MNSRGLDSKYIDSLYDNFSLSESNTPNVSLTSSLTSSPTKGYAPYNNHVCSTRHTSLSNRTKIRNQQKEDKSYHPKKSNSKNSYSSSSSYSSCSSSISVSKCSTEKIKKQLLESSSSISSKKANLQVASSRPGGNQAAQNTCSNNKHLNSATKSFLRSFSGSLGLQADMTQFLKFTSELLDHKEATNQPASTYLNINFMIKRYKDLLKSLLAITSKENYSLIENILVGLVQLLLILYPEETCSNLIFSSCIVNDSFLTKLHLDFLNSLRENLEAVAGAVDEPEREHKQKDFLIEHQTSLPNHTSQTKGDTSPQPGSHNTTTNTAHNSQPGIKEIQKIDFTHGNFLDKNVDILISNNSQQIKNCWPEGILEKCNWRNEVRPIIICKELQLTQVKEENMLTQNNSDLNNENLFVKIEDQHQLTEKPRGESPTIAAAIDALADHGCEEPSDSFLDDTIKSCGDLYADKEMIDLLEQFIPENMDNLMASSVDSEKIDLNEIGLGNGHETGSATENRDFAKQISEEMDNVFGDIDMDNISSSGDSGHNTNNITSECSSFNSSPLYNATANIERDQGASKNVNNSNTNLRTNHYSGGSNNSYHQPHAGNTQLYRGPTPINYPVNSNNYNSNPQLVSTPNMKTTTIRRVQPIAIRPGAYPIVNRSTLPTSIRPIQVINRNINQTPPPIQPMVGKTSSSPTITTSTPPPKPKRKYNKTKNKNSTKNDILTNFSDNELEFEINEYGKLVRNKPKSNSLFCLESDSETEIVIENGVSKISNDIRIPRAYNRRKPLKAKKGKEGKEAKEGKDSKNKDGDQQDQDQIAEEDSQKASDKKKLKEQKKQKKHTNKLIKAMAESIDDMMNETEKEGGGSSIDSSMANFEYGSGDGNSDMEIEGLELEEMDEETEIIGFGVFCD